MFDFNLDEIEDISFDLLPKAIYTFQVDKAEVNDTKDGTGQYINVELTVISEEQNGRKIFDLFNVVNKSEKAENIGKSNLKQLIIASGADIQIFTGPDQLVGLEFDALVIIKKGTGDYEDRNEIKKYLPIAGEEVEGQEGSTPTTDPDGTSSGDKFD